MNQSERDKKIEDVLNSIHLGYDRLERIEEELEEVRKKRGEIMSNNTSQGDKA